MRDTRFSTPFIGALVGGLMGFTYALATARNLFTVCTDPEGLCFPSYHQWLNFPAILVVNFISASATQKPILLWLVPLIDIVLFAIAGFIAGSLPGRTGWRWVVLLGLFLVLASILLLPLLSILLTSVLRAG